MQHRFFFIFLFLIMISNLSYAQISETYETNFCYNDKLTNHYLGSEINSSWQYSSNAESFVKNINASNGALGLYADDYFHTSANLLLSPYFNFDSNATFINYTLSTKIQYVSFDSNAIFYFGIGNYTGKMDNSVRDDFLVILNSTGKIHLVSGVIVNSSGSQINGMSCQYPTDLSGASFFNANNNCGNHNYDAKKYTLVAYKLNDTARQGDLYIDDILSCSLITTSRYKKNFTAGQVFFNHVRCRTFPTAYNYSQNSVAGIFNVKLENNTNPNIVFNPDLSCVTDNEILGLKFSTGNPLCKGNSSTYSVNMTGNTDTVLDVDCYNDGTFLSNHSTNPQVTCLYNDTGSYSANAWIYTYGRLRSTGVNLQHNVNVIADSYPNCYTTNLGNGQEINFLNVNATTVTGINIDNGINSFMDSLGLNTKFMKGILALIIILALNWGMFKIGVNTEMAYLSVNIVSVILLTWIGLLPSWIMFLIILCVAGFYAYLLSKAQTGNGV